MYYQVMEISLLFTVISPLSGKGKPPTLFKPRQRCLLLSDLFQELFPPLHHSLYHFLPYFKEKMSGST